MKPGALPPSSGRSLRGVLRFASGIATAALFTVVAPAVPALPTIITWDGGGADNNWTTAANWSTNTIPTQFDSVVFDGTSVKDCTMPGQVHVVDFTIGAAYTGEISGDVTVIVDGNFFADGGTVSVSTIELTGDLRYSGDYLDIRNRLELRGGDQDLNFITPDSYCYELRRSSQLHPGRFVLRGLFHLVDLSIASEVEAHVEPGSETAPPDISYIWDVFNAGDLFISGDPGGWVELGGLRNVGFCELIGGNVVFRDIYGYRSFVNEGELSFTGGTFTLHDAGAAAQFYTYGPVFQGIPIQGGWDEFVNQGVYDLEGDLTIAPGGVANFAFPGTLNIAPSATLTALGTSTYINSGLINEGGVILKEAVAIGLINGSGAAMFQFSFGEDLRILLIDPDENLNGAAFDHTFVSAVNLTGGDFEFIHLTETAVASGQFTNDSWLLPSAVGPAALLNGTLEGQPGETIALYYADDEDPADEISRMIASIPPPTASPTVTPSPAATPSPDATSTPTRTPTPTPDLTIPSPSATSTPSPSAEPTATPDCAFTDTTVLTSTGALDGCLWDNPAAQANGTNPGGNNTIASGSGIRIGEAEAQMSYLDFAYKSVLSFDTSAIPAGAVILGARLTLTAGPTVGSPATRGFGAPYVEIRRGHFGGSADFEFPGSPAPGNTDWAAPADAGNAMLSPLNMTGAETDLGAIVPWINQAGGPDGGVTQLRLRHPNLLYNTGGLHYWTFDSGEGVSPPLLSVDWCLPPDMPTPTPDMPTPTAAPCCPGDADNSGSFVDANDFIAVQAGFGGDNGVGGPGDADCSGSFVDANDFIAVQANFGADCL